MALPIFRFIALVYFFFFTSPKKNPTHTSRERSFFFHKKDIIFTFFFVVAPSVVITRAEKKIPFLIKSVVNIYGVVVVAPAPPPPLPSIVLRILNVGTTPTPLRTKKIYNNNGCLDC